MKRTLTLISGFLAISATVAAVPAFGQESKLDRIVRADPDREIVVEAVEEIDPEDLSVREVKKQARSITDATNIFGDPLPVFHKPVCPGVSGLPVDLATLIADRIRFNAERTGLRLAEGGECQPNFIVSFVANGQKALQEMADKGNTVFSMIDLAERRSLLNDPGPVHAFIVAANRTHTGDRPAWDPRGQYEVINAQQAHSLILLPMRTDIQISVVLIDIPAIDGMSAVQIADYATMRGLAKTRPIEGDPAFGSILNLFDEESRHPLELTAFDLAYLETVYKHPPNIAAAAKLGTVEGAMQKVLVAAAEADRALSE
ncbi:MAG TPA: hypothetical protein VLA37_14180 [Sphingomonadaceae bacterium]|nr:hypothetical protein [Sphingomonadaceae bacterium]